MGLTGAALGLSVVLVEQITRTAYIKVYWGPKQQSQVTLGPQPVLIGSSAEAHITIPSKSVADIAAAVFLLDKKIELEDRVSKTKRLLKIGDRLEYAHVTIEICSRGSIPGEPPVIQKPSVAGGQTAKEASDSKPKVLTRIAFDSPRLSDLPTADLPFLYQLSSFTISSWRLINPSSAYLPAPTSIYKIATNI